VSLLCGASLILFRKAKIPNWFDNRTGS